jgi:hypothetical protein
VHRGLLDFLLGETLMAPPEPRIQNPGVCGFSRIDLLEWTFVHLPRDSDARMSTNSGLADAACQAATFSLSIGDALADVVAPSKAPRPTIGRNLGNAWSTTTVCSTFV